MSIRYFSALLLILTLKYSRIAPWYDQSITQTYYWLSESFRRVWDNLSVPIPKYVRLWKQFDRLRMQKTRSRTLRTRSYQHGRHSERYWCRIIGWYELTVKPAAFRISKITSPDHWRWLGEGMILSNVSKSFCFSRLLHRLMLRVRSRYHSSRGFWASRTASNRPWACPSLWGNYSGVWTTLFFLHINKLITTTLECWCVHWFDLGAFEIISEYKGRY